MRVPRDGQTFLRFAAAMITSCDEDPMYPVLRWLLHDCAMEETLWMLVLFVAFYHVGSAWWVWARVPALHPLSTDALRLPCAMERRGLRGGVIARHVDAYCERVRQAGTMQSAWWQIGWTADPCANYELFWNQTQQVWGNGRWAAFKMADLAKKVLGWPLAAPDMRLAHCSGPKAGLAWLYRLPATAPLVCYEAVAQDLMAYVSDAGVLVDWETLETLCCNWHSLVTGRYYVGHDIDAQYVEMTAPFLDAHAQERLCTARRIVLPEAYLGEIHGWHGVQTARKTLYRDKGLLSVRISI